MRGGRYEVRIEGLAEADGLHLAQDVSDGLTALFLGEDLPDEGAEFDPATERVGAGVLPGPQEAAMASCVRHRVLDAQPFWEACV